MKSWYEIYSERMNSDYTNYVANRYAPFLEALYNVGAIRNTEIGCGAGNVTRILREMNKSKGSVYTMIDNCPKMLGLAIENNPVHGCVFKCFDARKVSISKSDLIYSHGLLEHFDDLDIRDVVENGLEAAPIQLHYVPTSKYKIPSRGDERLLSPIQWEHILRGLGRISVSTFNEDHDMIIRVEAR